MLAFGRKKKSEQVQCGNFMAAVETTGSLYADYARSHQQNSLVLKGITNLRITVEKALDRNDAPLVISKNLHLICGQIYHIWYSASEAKNALIAAECRKAIENLTSRYSRPEIDIILLQMSEMENQFSKPEPVSNEA